MEWIKNLFILYLWEKISTSVSMKYIFLTLPGYYALTVGFDFVTFFKGKYQIIQQQIHNTDCSPRCSLNDCLIY